MSLKKLAFCPKPCGKCLQPDWTILSEIEVHRPILGNQLWLSRHKDRTPMCALPFWSPETFLWGTTGTQQDIYSQIMKEESYLNQKLFSFLFQFFPSIMTFGLLWFIGGLLLKACAIQNYFKFHAGDSVCENLDLFTPVGDAVWM